MDKYLLLIALLILMAGIAILAVQIYRRMRDPLRYKPEKDDAPDWLLGTLCVVTLFALNAWLDTKDAKHLQAMQNEIRIAELINAGYLRPDLALLPVDLNQCPPRTPGTTDLVLITIATQSDGGHIFHGCKRIAARPAAKSASRITLVSAPPD